MAVAVTVLAAAAAARVAVRAPARAERRERRLRLLLLLRRGSCRAPRRLPRCGLVEVVERRWRERRGRDAPVVEVGQLVVVVVGPAQVRVGRLGADRGDRRRERGAVLKGRKSGCGRGC